MLEKQWRFFIKISAAFEREVLVSKKVHIISNSFNIIHKIWYLISQWTILSIGFDKWKLVNDFCWYFLAFFYEIFINFDGPTATTPQLVPFFMLSDNLGLFFTRIFLVIWIVFILAFNSGVIVLVLLKIRLLALNSVHISWFRIIILFIFRIELRHLSRGFHRTQFTFALVSRDNWSTLLLFESFVLISWFLIGDPWLNYWSWVRCSGVIYFILILDWDWDWNRFQV